VSLKVKDHFEKQYSNFYGSPKHISFVIYDEQLWKLCLQNIKEADLVADYGSGGGTLLYNVGHFSKARLLGIEQSELAIVQSKNLVPDLNVIKGNTMDTPLKNESIDFIFSTMVIEHVDDKKAIEAMNRVLKKDGRVYLSTVFKKWYAWYFYRNNGRWVLDPTHLREYSREAQLLDLILASGFRVLENQKSLFWFPFIDFFVKRIEIKNRSLYENRILSLLRRIKVPILGYYNWELVLVKP